MTILESFSDFLALGGPVVEYILGLSFLLWTLVAERFLFFRWVYPKHRQRWLGQWAERHDKHSWYAHKIRDALISQARLQLGKTLLMIKTLVGLCPLLGLLGTVTGMIHMFDALAVFGSGNARAMATHISHATLPTMAGMTVAIAGMYFTQRIEHRVEDETRLLTDMMHFD